MKRLLLLALIVLVVLSGVIVVVIRSRPTPRPKPKVLFPSLVRVPNSAYKYPLCLEAYAYSMASPDNPYKTDDTFQDPFRRASDTITPNFLGLDWHNGTFDFEVDMMIGHVATYHLSITHVQSLDGIALILPDAHHQLQRPSIPQFIVSSVEGAGAETMAIIDFTCPEQWVWKTVPA